MRQLASIQPLLVVLLGVAVCVHGCGGGSEESEIDKHLAAEAVRLAANADKIEQEDAAWIASKLGRSRRASRVRELLNERVIHVYEQYSERLKAEHPELWHYPRDWGQENRGRNGMDALQSVSKLADDLTSYSQKNEWLRKLEDFDSSTLSKSDAEAFMRASRMVPHALMSAAKADGVRYFLPRMESFLDAFDSQPSTSVFRVAVARVRIHAQAGDYDAAVQEMQTIMQVLGRMEVIGLIQQLLVNVNEKLVFQAGVKPLAISGKVPVEVLQEWSNIGRSISLDPVLSIALELAGNTRVNAAEWRTMVNTESDLDWIEMNLGYGDPYLSLEEYFEEIHRMWSERFKVFAYAMGERPPSRSLEGVQEALAAEPDGYAGFQRSIMDNAVGGWRWAALELLIAQREHGSLRDNPEVVENVLQSWPGLRAEWTEDAVELWINPDTVPVRVPRKTPIARVEFAG